MPDEVIIVLLSVVSFFVSFIVFYVAGTVFIIWVFTKKAHWIDWIFDQFNQ